MVKSIVAFYESQEKNGHNFRFFINLRRKLSSENFCRKRQLYHFLQNLSEEAHGCSNVVLCVSIPASELEMTPEDHRDYEAIKKLLDRLGKAVIMSTETEIAEIIRRRLFDWGGLPDDAKITASSYANWVIEHKQMVGDFDVDSAHDRFQRLLSVPPRSSVGLREEMAKLASLPK